MADEQRSHPDPRQFGGAWAKVEIVLGLFAAGLGLLLGNWALGRTPAEVEWGMAAVGLALFVLSGYLALAGHRSHLYRSNMQSTACLIEEIRRLKDKG